MPEQGLWYHKYRPTTLDEYIWKDDTVRKEIEDWIEDPSRFRNLVLAGPWGTGKTSLALLMKDLLDLDSTDYLFINGSLNTGIDTIRQDIVSHCENGGWGVLKIVVIDEAERISNSAQESLKGVMDMYGEYTRFIFTTNRIGRISGGLLSRSRIIMVDSMSQEDFVERLAVIARKEEVIGDEATDEEIGVIIEITVACYPDMRKAIGLLQDCSSDGTLKNIPEDTITDATWVSFIVDTLAGTTSIDRLRQGLNEVRADEMVDIYRYLYENVTELCGADPASAIILIAEYLDRHGRSAFPDVTLSALLLMLQEYATDETR